MQKRTNSLSQFFFWLLFLGIIGIGISGIYTYWICPKEYQSKATMHIEFSAGQEEKITQEKNIQKTLEENFQTIAKNKEILSIVKQKLNDDFQPSVDTLQKDIQVSLDKNGTILSFQTTASNPFWAQKELQAVGQTWIEILPKKLKIQRLSWQKEPNFSPKPSQPKVLLQLGIGGIIGSVIGAIIGLISMLFAKRKKYIHERYLQTLAAPIIGSIPSLTETIQKPIYQKEGERQIEEYNAMVDDRLLGETQHLETLTRSRRKRKK